MGLSEPAVLLLLLLLFLRLLLLLPCGRPSRCHVNSSCYCRVCWKPEHVHENQQQCCYG
jgi:hypothetical protein